MAKKKKPVHSILRAKKTVSRKPVPKKKVVKKVAPKKAAAKKKTVKKAVKKVVAKKAAAKKKAPAKRSSPKKAVAKKVSVKKPVAKKAVAKKVVVKKALSKKVAKKKAAPQKIVPAKVVTKKPVAQVKMIFPEVLPVTATTPPVSVLPDDLVGKAANVETDVTKLMVPGSNDAPLITEDPVTAFDKNVFNKATAKGDPHSNMQFSSKPKNAVKPSGKKPLWRK